MGTSHRFGSPASRFRGISILGLVLLVGIVGIFILAKVLTEDQQTKQAVLDRNIMMDPKGTAEYYVQMAWTRHDFQTGRWEKLLEFMTDDDVAWFEDNKRYLASMNPRMEGMLAMAVSEREREFGAIGVLTNFERNDPGNRPIVSTVESKPPYAVAFVHPQGQPGQMYEIFMLKEGQVWKIRRWAGARDKPNIAREIAETKQFGDEPLTPDERAVLEDPKLYSENKRAALLREVGLTP